MERNVKVYKLFSDMDQANVFLNAKDADGCPVLYEGLEGVNAFLELLGASKMQGVHGESVSAVDHEFMTLGDAGLEESEHKLLLVMSLKIVGNMSYFRFTCSLIPCMDESLVITSEGFTDGCLSELRYVSRSRKEFLSVERIINAMDGKDEYGIHVDGIKKDVISFLENFYLGMEFDESRVNMLFKHEYDKLIEKGSKIYRKSYNLT